MMACQVFCNEDGRLDNCQYSRLYSDLEALVQAALARSARVSRLLPWAPTLLTLPPLITTAAAEAQRGRSMTTMLMSMTVQRVRANRLKATPSPDDRGA